MQIRVIGGVSDLRRDQGGIAKRARRDLRGVVRKNVASGNKVAKGLAKDRSGKHAKGYPGTFTTRMHRDVASRETGGNNLLAGEFGPLNVGQGNLASVLEEGSRNNPAHHELADAADVTTPQMVRDVRGLCDEWFW